MQEFESDIASKSMNPYFGNTLYGLLFKYEENSI